MLAHIVELMRVAVLCAADCCAELAQLLNVYEVSWRLLHLIWP
jgi:hypothetical protein